MNTRIAAVIVAAGQATRFGAPKVLSPIDGIPAITRVVRTFQSVASLEHIIVVISDALRRQFELALAHCLADTRVAIMIGGNRRQDSVLAGVRAAREAEIVIVHDGARPLVTTELIEASISALLPGADATVTAVPVTDTIKRMADGGFETVDRDNLWRAQTPQAFRREILLRELERALDDGLEVTDEATLIERAGGRVLLVAGSDRNLKLTVPSDLVLAEALLSSESTPPEPPSRTGIGYDVHRLVAGRDLVIGGVTIPNDHGLEGHSDADVLLHAISDALLGACALGDIGRHFPPTDARYRGISSLILLERVRALLDERGFRVINVDATVIAEAPHLGPHIGAMRTAISHALGLPVTRIGVKATTNEGIGFAGRREGIAAMAVATVWKAG